MGVVKWTSRTIDTTEEAWIYKIFSVKRGTPREPDTASRREEACLLNPCNVAAQLITSQPVTVDLTMTFISQSDVLAQVGSRENSSHHPLCTAHSNTFCATPNSCKK